MLNDHNRLDKLMVLMKLHIVFCHQLHVFVISICNKKKVDFIIPFSDEEALNFSKNIDKFNKIKVKVLVSDYKITRFVSNKLSLM